MRNPVTPRHTAFPSAIAPQPRTETERRLRNRDGAFADAIRAVEWLNATKGSPAYKRVVGLRAHLAALSGSMDAYQREEAPEALLKIRGHFRAVNEILARCSYVPVVAIDAKANVLRWNAASKADRGPVVTVSDGELTVEVREADAAMALLRLASGRVLYQARLCDQCKSVWIVSGRQMDRFCSAGCREAWYTKSDAYRQRRREIQRNYREQLRRKIAAEDARQKGRRP